MVANMNRRTLDRTNVDISYLEVFDKHDRKKSTSQWNSSSSNEESVFDPKSEILWSREKNCHFSENDFFRNFQDSFSDLTERSTSTCSWHNDDFDMNSSNKVKASLEAIEDALYDGKESSSISQSVYRECCEWSSKFPFFRLKGEQIIKPIDSSLNLYPCLDEQHARADFESPISKFQIEGKKMAIHVPEKVFRRTVADAAADTSREPEEYSEEIFYDDEEYEDCLELDIGDTCNKMVQTKFLNEVSTAASIKAIQEKVIEKIALEMWPKVVAVLQKVKEVPVHDLSEDFQLPPIVAAVERRQISARRPNTEGMDLSSPDFPKLNSILTISPKVLQSRQDYGSWRGSLRSSRPNSEIPHSRRNHTVPGLGRKNETSKGYGSFSQLNKTRQVYPSSTRTAFREEKEHGNVSLFLPALEEDIPGSDGILNGFYLEPEIKRSSPATCEITTLTTKKSECFLPPIEGTSHLTSNVKLTRNLFTFFGSQLNCDKDYDGPVVQPISRPNTSASKKSMKYSRNLNHNGHSSINNTSIPETKKLSEANSDKQVTLFPIVTSLVPSKEKNIKTKKGLLNTFIGGRKR